MQLTRFYHLSYVDKQGERHIFYVGRTTSPLARRFSGHKRDAKKGRTRKGKLMQALMKQRLAVEITEITQTDTYDKEVVAAIEDTLIRTYRANGHVLQNESSGNSGCVPGDQQEIQLAPEIESLLGTMPDSDIAKMVPCSQTTIRYKRESKGIPAFRKFQWTPDLLDLLGKVSDTVVAEKAGISLTTVGKKRISLGIPLHIIDIPHELLGKVPDREIARRVGCHASHVGNIRQRLGIPAFKKEIFTEDTLGMIGTMSDTDLASIIGCCRVIVSRKRAELGIPAYKKPKAA